MKTLKERIDIFENEIVAKEDKINNLTQEIIMQNLVQEASPDESG